MTDPKVILTSLSGSPEEAVALEYACLLARRYGAHIKSVHVAPDLEELAATLSGFYATSFYPLFDIEKMEAENRARANALREKIEVHLRAKGLGDASFHYRTGRVGPVLAEQARTADLTVLARAALGGAQKAVFNSVLFGSGQPLLLVPAGIPVRPSFDKVMIAWNGSREAARALAAALPYLSGSHVTVFMRTEELHGAAVPMEAVMLYLRHHGIKARPLVVPDDSEPVPYAIARAAFEIGADLVVLGAWGHNRLREYMLGGVTDFMLEEADVPLFMCH